VTGRRTNCATPSTIGLERAQAEQGQPRRMAVLLSKRVMMPQMDGSLGASPTAFFMTFTEHIQ